MFKSLRNRVRRFSKDRRGVSAVEFAMILPVFAVCYFGAIEVSFLMGVDRKVTGTSSSLADLVARDTTINNSEMQDIFKASSAIFSPYDGSKAKMRVTSVIMENGKVEVDWSQAKNMSPLSKGASVAVPPGVLTEGESVIMAEISFDYDSTLGFFLQDTMKMEETFYLRPRRVKRVEFKS